MLNTDRPDIGKGGLLELLDRYPVTFGAIGACLILYIYSAYNGGGSPMIRGEVLARLGACNYQLVFDEPWRLLTAAFLHFDPLHIICNCLALYLIGRPLEIHYGSSRLWVLYVMCALAGSLGSLSWYALRLKAGSTGPLGPPPENLITAGASGALFGLIFIGYVYASSVSERLGTLATSLRRWIVIGIVFTFLYPRVDIAGHVGGAAAGALAGMVVQPVPGKSVHPAWTYAAYALTALCLICFGAVMWTLRQGAG